MAWVRITGGFLVIAGMVGLIFGAESVPVSVVLCIAGMAAWIAALIAQRRRGKRDSLGVLDDVLDNSDGSTDFDGHHSHHGGHDHPEGHDHGGGHDVDWWDHGH